ncbi:MAG: hypothetical protein ACREBM_06435, partial [Sphingomicrobium sp.]
WKLFGTALALWLAGLLLNPISAPMIPMPLPIRLIGLMVVAGVQAAAVIAAAALLMPMARRHMVRLWSIGLLAAAVVMTSLYHFSWLQRLSG